MQVGASRGILRRNLITFKTSKIAKMGGGGGGGGGQNSGGGEGREMGRYMRKCSRGIGEVAVMEVTQVVGVRTRARALALAAAEAAAPGAANSNAGDKRRKVSEDSEFRVSCLQLRSRSRSLILSQAKNKEAAANGTSDTPATSRCSETAGNLGSDGQCGSYCGDGEWDRVSRCSSNQEISALAAAATTEKPSSRSGVPAPEVHDCSETTACNYDGDLQRWSERVQPSKEKKEPESDDLESTARPGELEGGARRRNAATEAAAASGMSSPLMPSEDEIEEFLAAAEKQEWQRFAEKYNYDVVKDVPLEGRYEWVQIKP